MQNTKRVFIVNSKLGARMHLNSDISVTVLAVNKKRVRLGFSAPINIAVPQVLPPMVIQNSYLKFLFKRWF